MYTQFFGNYLLSKHYVTKEALYQAIEKQQRIRPRIGTLAMHQGFMKASQVVMVMRQQTKEDKEFGEIAIQMGFLTKEQLEMLLCAQTPDFVTLGEVLVENHAMTLEELDQAMEEYKKYSGITDENVNSMMHVNLHNLISNYLVRTGVNIPEILIVYLELLFHNLIRFIGEDFTIGDIHEISNTMAKSCVVQKITGPYQIDTYLNMEKSTVIPFSSRFAGEFYTDYDAYVDAAFRDFMNLHNGLFAVNMSNEKSIELKLTPPVRIDDKAIYFDGKVYEIPVEFSFGKIVFYVGIV